MALDIIAMLPELPYFLLEGQSMTRDDEIIEISEKDLVEVDESIIEISETDLIRTSGGVANDAKPFDLKSWNPQTDAQPGRESIDIVLLIDTSGSMGAIDYKPNRLMAAKEAAKMFTTRKVTQNYKDRVAVIGFGGRPTVIQSLDSDLGKAAAAIGRLQITHSGTMIGHALQAAKQELQSHQTKRQAVVLLSDGGDEYDSSKPVQVIAGMKDIVVFAIGMGTLKGGMASLPHGSQRVCLNEKLLRQIAEVGGGDYVYAPDVSQLQHIYLQLADY